MRVRVIVSLRPAWIQSQQARTSIPCDGCGFLWPVHSQPIDGFNEFSGRGYGVFNEIERMESLDNRDHRDCSNPSGL
jgi:hypothetical protein